MISIIKKLPDWRMKTGSPLYILQKRFASGQITNEEYREKKKILGNDSVKKI